MLFARCVSSRANRRFLATTLNASHGGRRLMLTPEASVDARKNDNVNR